MVVKRGKHKRIMSIEHERILADHIKSKYLEKDIPLCDTDMSCLVIQYYYNNVYI